MSEDSKLFRCVKAGRAVRFLPDFNDPLEPLMQWARRRPTTVAVEFDIPGTHHHGSRTYHQLLQNVLTASQTLTQLPKGTLGIITGLHGATVEAVFASLAAGRQFVVVDPLSSPFSRALDKLALCSPVALILPSFAETPDILVDKLAIIREQLPGLQYWSLGPSTLADTDLLTTCKAVRTKKSSCRRHMWDRIAALVYADQPDASGRAYGYTVSALYAGATAVMNWLALTDRKRVLCTIDPSHCGGLIILLAAVLSGTTCVLRTRLRADDFWSVASETNVELAQLHAALIEQLLAGPLRPVPAAGVKLKQIVVRTNQLPVRSVLEFFERFEVPLINCYGGAETGGYVLGVPLALSRRAYEVALQANVTGEELDFCNVRLEKEGSSSEDLNGNIEEGLLSVRGPSVSSGYWDGRSVRHWETPWLATDDLAGMCDLSNRRCYIVRGRAQESVTIEGHRVWPTQVEHSLLDTFVFLEECVVVRRPEGAGNEQLCAVVVLPDDVGGLRRSEMVAMMEARLTAGGVNGLNDKTRPGTVLALPRGKIPRDETGRPDRAALNRLLCDGWAGGLAAS